MSMRAQVARPEQTIDAWNQPSAPVFRDIGLVPCRVYENASRLILDGNKKAVIGEFRGMFPLDVDLQNGDHLTDVMDRQNEVLFKGPFEVEKLVNKKHHLESRLISHA